ncbi:uncharacterized protein FIBRA_04117 [Fibroporia radiculosa]|uniref:F-box domain-containing protein n=1 Tax=Fibroporia radiculosa TaxID=599839 RepID=J4I9Z9_9APHY|nr:uncharacterized protein FIBRA_04117 [Fibroporia radiculosa]CCM02041.1 predicted protein [Fibroporia radiculosa]
MARILLTDDADPMKTPRLLTDAFSSQSYLKPSLATYSAMGKVADPFFRDASLGILWEELDSIVPLFCLLPRHVVSKHLALDTEEFTGWQWAFSKPSSDMRRIMYYNKFIKHFHWKGSSEIAIEPLRCFFAASSACTLFPRIRSFHWHGWGFRMIRSPSSFVNSLLEDLRISADKEDSFAISCVLNSVRMFCDNLRVFHLVPRGCEHTQKRPHQGEWRSPYTGLVEDQVCALVCQTNLVEFRSTCALSVEGIVALARMPNLQRVELRLPEDSRDQREVVRQFPQLPFISVKEFRVHTNFLAGPTLDFLGSALISGTLSLFAIWVFYPPSEKETKILCKTLRGQWRPRRCLHRIYCYLGHQSFFQPPDPPQLPVWYVNLEVIQPLLALPITDIVIYAAHVKFVTRQHNEIESCTEMAKAWPHLNTVWMMPKDSDDMTPLSAMVPFVEHCRELENIGFCVAPSPIPVVPDEWTSSSRVSTHAFFSSLSATDEESDHINDFIAILFPIWGAERARLNEELAEGPDAQELRRGEEDAEDENDGMDESNGEQDVLVGDDGNGTSRSETRGKVNLLTCSWKTLLKKLSKVRAPW